MPDVQCPICRTPFHVTPSRLRDDLPEPTCSRTCSRLHRAARLTAEQLPDPCNRRNQTLSKLPKTGLLPTFIRVEIEAGKSFSQILDDLNTACDTRFDNDWLSRKVKNGCVLGRIHPESRRYMMRVMLTAEHDSGRLQHPDIDTLLANLL